MSKTCLSCCCKFQSEHKNCDKCIENLVKKCKKCGLYNQNIRHDICDQCNYIQECLKCGKEFAKLHDKMCCDSCTDISLKNISCNFCNIKSRFIVCTKCYTAKSFKKCDIPVCNKLTTTIRCNIHFNVYFTKSCKCGQIFFSFGRKKCSSCLIPKPSGYCYECGFHVDLCPCR